MSKKQTKSSSTKKTALTRAAVLLLSQDTEFETNQNEFSSEDDSEEEIVHPQLTTKITPATKTFLHTLTVKKLRQLCRNYWIYFPSKSTKSELVDKLKIPLSIIKQYIAEIKDFKYMIICSNTEEFLSYRPKYRHIYYTNHSVLTNKYEEFYDGRRVNTNTYCEQCKCICAIIESDNFFHEEEEKESDSEVELSIAKTTKVQKKDKKDSHSRKKSPISLLFRETKHNTLIVSSKKNNFTQEIKHDVTTMKPSSILELSTETKQTMSKTTKKKSIPKKVRSDVWNLCIGADKGEVLCPLCNMEKIQQGACNDWDCAHIVPECRGGQTTITNLRVICKGCNSSMGRDDMREFCSYYPGSLQRLSLPPLS